MDARNGVIHEIDRVNEPLPTLETLLMGEDYSDFRNLIESKTDTGEPYYYTYLATPLATEYFKKMYPSLDIDIVFVKYYLTLYIPLNSERYIDYYSTNPIVYDAETGGHTLFAPNNDALKKFYNEIIEQYDYESIEELPRSVIEYFIDAHMVNSMVWPGDYNTSKNERGDFLNGEGKSGQGFDRAKYYDPKPASNGFFYGSNDYIKSRYFETVYTEIMMRPNKYTMMNRALREYPALLEELLKCTINGYTDENYTVLLLSDELLAADGFSYTIEDGFANSNYTEASQRMQRLLRSHIFRRIHNSQIDARMLNFDGDPAIGYDGYVYSINDYGDIIRYKDGKIQMLGNMDTGEAVTATMLKTFTNGQVFSIDKLLLWSESETNATTINQRRLDDLIKLRQNNQNVRMYIDYIIYITSSQYFTSTTATAPVNATYGSGTLDVPDFKRFTMPDGLMTILMPNDEALTQAIEGGYLRSLSAIRQQIANSNGANFTYLDEAINFFRYHFSIGGLYINDGYDKILLNTGRVQDYMPTATAYKILINNTYLRFDKFEGNLRVSTDRSAHIASANVMRGFYRSNLLTARAVMHEIDNFMLYKPLN